MRNVSLASGRSYSNNVSGVAVATLVAAAFVLSAGPARPATHASAPQPLAQKTFASPEDACKALVAAARNNDEKAMLDILGPDAKRIVWSGDDAEDARNRANFVSKFQEMHRLVLEDDGSMVLYIGAENWPTPIPLLFDGGAWHFDTAAGEQEILYRRIGRNELSAIKVCQELAAAQKEYSGQYKQYPEKVYSDEGRHNGLYWKDGDGKSESLIGPVLAQAFIDGYTGNSGGVPSPFRGYYFHVLSRRGAQGGLAFLAYPADYRSSGVMTFMVDEDGVVYQKDLGKNTESLARATKDCNVGPGWQRAEDDSAEVAQGHK